MVPKLSIFQVITVVKQGRGGCWFGNHCSMSTGCQVCSQEKPEVGTEQRGVPMLRPNVKRVLNLLKNSKYQGTPSAIANCVNAGSLSMKAENGMRAYSSRQNQHPPERSRNRSALRQMLRQ